MFLVVFVVSFRYTGTWRPTINEDLSCSCRYFLENFHKIGTVTNLEQTFCGWILLGGTYSMSRFHSVVVILLESTITIHA